MIAGFGLDQINEYVTAGGILGLLTLAAKLYIDNRRMTLAITQDNRGGHESLIGLLEARVGRLEEAEQRCQRDLNDALHRIAQLEGYDAGQGQARNEVTRLQANTRAADKDNGK